MNVVDLYQEMSYGPAPESDQMARQWLDSHSRKFGHWISGQWTQESELFEVFAPATGELLAQVSQGSAEDIDAAVSAAANAQIDWWALGPEGRARHLYALARQVQKHARLFSVLESLDNGKPIRETRDIDIPLVARHFYHHAGWAALMAERLPDAQPLGVVGQVIPWNFPLLMLAWKVAPALAMGNTVVLKPAEFTPLTALLFAEIAGQAGLPAGVLNIVTGDGRTGAALVEHPRVAKIAFTGSTEVGRIIRKATAGSGKKLSLELGGKSPFVVFDDCDLDSVVEGVVDAIWFNQGQVCCAGSRLIVQEGIADLLHNKLRARMEKLRVGHSLDKAVDMGAIVAPVQLDRIRELVEEGRAEGVACWQPSWACPTEGLFYPPTLFTSVAPASKLAQVEIFGPVLVSTTFRRPEEACELANNTPFGLAASVWSENIHLALDIARQIKAGTVWVNCTNQFDAASGFGGYRESGYGREGGLEGLWEYVQLKKLAPGREPSDVSELPTRPENPLQIDETAKNYIGGKQVRPDSGYSLVIRGAAGERLGEVADGNRKDIRNAVEAAQAAARGWASSTGHSRAQILFFVAENLSQRAAGIADRLSSMTGQTPDSAQEELEASINELFRWAAWADKHDGMVHHTNGRWVTLAMPEPIGVVGALCPREKPLLGLIRATAPLIAMGNTVVAIPSETHPLAATDFYQVLETSDVPGGVWNLVTGLAKNLTATLAEHHGVDAVWCWNGQLGEVEAASISNLKRTWGGSLDDLLAAPSEQLVREATQIKNIWVPYGD